MQFAERCGAEVRVCGPARRGSARSSRTPRALGLTLQGPGWCRIGLIGNGTLLSERHPVCGSYQWLAQDGIEDLWPDEPPRPMRENLTGKCSPGKFAVTDDDRASRVAAARRQVTGPKWLSYKFPLRDET